MNPISYLCRQSMEQESLTIGTYPTIYNIKSKGMNIEANKKLWANIVAKAWCDEAYKAELLNNPEQVLKA